jgi:taurine transport system substrate-binding protein
MQVKRRTFLKTAAGTAACLTLPGLAAAASATVINYGGSAWLGHYPAYIAIRSGMFSANGLDVRWQPFGTSSARMSGLLSGGIDIAGTGIVSALALMARGSKHFSIVGTAEDFGKVEGLFAARDVQSVKDLRGKKIGVTFASSSHLLVLDLLSSAGLNPERDVSLLNVPAPELTAALQGRQIDAVAAWTPYFSKIRALPNTRLLADDTSFSLFKQFGVTPGPDVLVVRRAFGADHADAVRRFMQTYFQASVMLREKPEEAAKHLTELTGLTLPDQIATIKEASWYDLKQQQGLLQPASKYVTGLQKLSDLLLTHKQLDRSPPVRDWINVSYL